MPKLLPLLVVLFASVGGVARAAGPSFIHPGLLHSREDLARMKAAIAAKAEPIAAGFEKFRAHPASQSTYVSRGAAEEIGRNPSVNQAQFDADANAAYQCALMWCLTGDRAFAETAKRIVNAWSATLQRVTGADAVLMAGLGPFKLINAAELLRHTDAGWSAAEAGRTEAMLRRAIYPALQDFALFANGNWDTAAIKTLLALGVFCDDRSIYERALRYYVDGAGNGRLTHYIITDTGQCQESGRDMGHTQLGLGHLGDACEIAWNQGLDLYGYADNRLLKGFEYTARYNLGEDVPFAETLDRTGKYHHKKISTIGRGALRPVFEQIYHHHVNRAGLAAPWTQKAAETLRPEGAARPTADHPGFGTLFFTRTADTVTEKASASIVPCAPGALVVRSEPHQNALTWIPSRGATHYTVSRATRRAWAVLATNVSGPSFVDSTITPGQRYTYHVTAENRAGASFPSDLVSVGESPTTEALGPRFGDNGFYNGNLSSFNAGGEGIGGRRDRFRFASMPAAGNCRLEVRFMPPVSSQRSQFGLMIRESDDPGSAHAALLVASDSSGESERPSWQARLVVRESTGAGTKVVAEMPLEAPHVSYGRLVKGFSLALTRTGHQFSAAISLTESGAEFREIGSISLPLTSKVLVGAVGSSRSPTLTTTITLVELNVMEMTP